MLMPLELEVEHSLLPSTNVAICNLQSSYRKLQVQISQLDIERY